LTTEQQIEQFILNEVLMSARGKRLDYDESLLDSGILDSLSLLRLIAFIQDELGVEIDVEEIVPDNFQTISAAARLVESKR
jgi:acyl carrier protein